MPDVKDDDNRGLDPECKSDMTPKADESQNNTIPDRYHSAPLAKLKADQEAANLMAITKQRAEFQNHLERRKILLTMQKKQDVIESLQDRLLNMIETCHRPESGEGLANNITLDSPSPDPDKTELSTRNYIMQTASPSPSQSKESVHKDSILNGLETSHSTLNPLVKYADQNLTMSPPPVPLQIIGQKVKSTQTSRTSININECSSENLESWQQRGGSHGIRSLIDIKKKLDDANILSKALVYAEEKVELPRTTMNLEIKGKAPEEKLISTPGPLPKIKAAQRKKEKTAQIKNHYQNVNCIERDKEFCPMVNSYVSDEHSKVLPVYRKIKDQKDAMTKMAEPPADDHYTKFANDKLPSIHRQNDMENLAKEERMLQPSTLLNVYEKREPHNLTTITREKEVRNLPNQKLVPTLCPNYEQKVANNLMPHTPHKIHQKPGKKLNRMFNNAATTQKPEPLTNITLPPINNLHNRYTADNRLFLKGRTLPNLDSQPKILHDFYDKNVGVSDGYCLRIPKPPQKVKMENTASPNGQCKLPAIVHKWAGGGSRRIQR